MEVANSIKELIELLKTRTPMYIGGNSISLLKAFLDGWAFRTKGVVEDSYLMNNFQKWIQLKYDIQTSQSWSSIILFYSQDEHDALDKFFQLWDEYLKNQEGES